MKILLSFTLLFASASLLGQGNLQFNQVINIEPGSSYTVPSGKVLKIESITTSGSSVCLPLTSTSVSICGAGYATVGNYNGVDYMTIGNMVYSTGNATNVCGYPSCYAKTVTVPAIGLPFWLPSGKTVNIFANTFPMVISAIEFNIIP